MTTVTKEEHRGQPCEFYDPRGKMYPALITEVWGPQCVNVIYVNDVEGQRDNYGQKMLRATSIMHGNVQQAHGNYFLLPNEKREFVKQPEDSAA